MSAGSFVTGNMHYIRAPFVANIKPGHRVLLLSAPEPFEEPEAGEVGAHRGRMAADPRIEQPLQVTGGNLGARREAERPEEPRQPHPIGGADQCLD